MTRSRALVFLAPALLLASAAVRADETIPVCFNYGCVARMPATYTEEQLGLLRDALAAAKTSAHERGTLAVAIGQLYGWAARQTPIGNDKAGNYADGGDNGRMDCIDHSTTTTRFLRVLEARGWLRFHRTIEPVRRVRIIYEHMSAAIEDLGDGIDVVPADGDSRTWVVDSWYADNGRPAWVAPIREWRKHLGLDV